MLQPCGALCIFTSKVLFATAACNFDFAAEHLLRTRRFNRPTFRLTPHTNHWKNTAFRNLSNIWRGCIFSLLTFALVHLLPSDLTACLICISTLHFVGSLLFKLPSIRPHWFFLIFWTPKRLGLEWGSRMVGILSLEWFLDPVLDPSVAMLICEKIAP